MRVHVVFLGLSCGVAPGCHLGRPPANFSAVRVASVVAPVAEPALPEAVEVGLARALARERVGVGGPQLHARVLRADDRVVAVGASGARVHAVTLEVAFELIGAAPRNVVLRGERSYEVDASRPDAAVAARAAAFDALAARLGADAVQWVLYAPESG